MEYYEVYVADPGYLRSEPLTYQFAGTLQPGTIVYAPIKNKRLLGIVVQNVTKPRFTTKPLELVLHLPALPIAAAAFFEWLITYYPTGSGSLARQFLPGNLPKTLSSKGLPAQTLTNLPEPKTTNLPKLTAQQSAALQTLRQTNVSYALLHGDTGSGKTRVYIERAIDTIRTGKSVILLTPEIALTPQTGQTFRDVFGARVIILHSALTAKQRRELWFDIVRTTEPLVIIGPRSALFAPLHHVGLIVIDEAHDGAYKQDQSPRYLATRAASALATIHGAQTIAGSATPLIAEYYVANAKHMPIIRMTDAAVSSNTTVTNSIIDLRDKAQFSRSQHLADSVIEAIASAVSKQEQVLVYLNRRGTARVVMCNNCGWQALCPHCDLPLTYHGDTHTMRCHSCAFSGDAPTVCPECTNTDLLFKSIGTKAITDELLRLFPQARIRRFDTDVSESERFEKHYADIRDGGADIIVGTQMLAKGLDLPKLSIVVVASADSSLQFPDFTASERTYQLLYQVLGRVGRGHRDASVFVQTYQPTNPVLIAAVTRNWDQFYQTEIAERKTFRFPPFCFLLKLSCARKTQAGAVRTAHELYDRLAVSGLAVEINGPTPSFYEHMGGEYHWQIILKSKDRQSLLEAIKLLPANWSYDLDPINLL